MLRMRMLALSAGAVAAVLLAGCQVDAHDKGNGKEVKIATPFGGLHVSTDDSKVLEEIGMAAYPGAQPEKKKDNDDGAADLNMSFGDLQLRVKAVSYRTDDAPDKVEAFYRDQMKRYGDVIKCNHNQPIGKPSRTFEGLTCDDHHGKHVSVDDHPDKNEVELRAGSQQHERIVSLEPDGSGTKFGLVVLDLPKAAVSNDE